MDSDLFDPELSRSGATPKLEENWPDQESISVIDSAFCQQFTQIVAWCNVI